MGDIIWITSGKGGNGTSTITANIAHHLGLIGKKVCLLDMNFGYSSLDLILDLSDKAVYNIYDVLFNNIDYKKVIVTTGYNKNLSLIAGSQKEVEHFGESCLNNFFHHISNEFDYILIDKNIINTSKINEFLCYKSKNIVFVTHNDSISLRNCDKAIDNICNTTEEEKLKLIINKLDLFKIQNKTEKNIDEILDMLGINLLGILPCDNSEKYEATSMIFSSQSGGYSNFKNIAKRLTGEKVSLYNFTNNNNLFSILKKAIKK